MASDNQNPVDREVSEISMTNGVAQKISVIQANLDSLKQLMNDADTIRVNREDLINRLEKINTSLKEINYENITANVTNDFIIRNLQSNEIDDESNHLKTEQLAIEAFLTRKLTITQFKFHTDEIEESIIYLKNMGKEIMEKTKQIDHLKQELNSECSFEEREEKIKFLENEKKSLKEDMFNFVVATMDHNYEYKHLVSELETANNDMSDEIFHLEMLIYDLKTRNKFLLNENIMLRRNITTWNPEQKLSIVKSEASSFNEDIGAFDSISSSTESSKAASVSSFTLDALMANWTLTDDHLKEVLDKKLQETNDISIICDKLKELKNQFHSRATPLLNLNTFIDPRIHPIPR